MLRAGAGTAPASSKSNSRPCLRLGILARASADPARAGGVLIVGAESDDVVPPENVKALAAAYGKARLEWIPGNHYAILPHIGRVMDWATEHLLRAFPPP